MVSTRSVAPTNPESRALNVPEEHEAIGRGYVADLRAAAARSGHDPVSEQLVADLAIASSEFAQYWSDMQVSPLQTTRKSSSYDEARGGRNGVVTWGTPTLSAGSGDLHPSSCSTSAPSWVV